MFFSVYGKIVAQNAPAESEEAHVESQEPSAREEEAVERDGSLACNNLFFLRNDARRVEEAYSGNDESRPEQDVEVVEIMMQVNSDGGRDGRCQIVAQSVKSYALVSARRRKDIDCHRAVRHGARPERSAVKRTEDGKEYKTSSHDISAEDDEI